MTSDRGAFEQAKDIVEEIVRGETIICMAPRAWNSLWRDSQHIMSRLARYNRILHFEPGRNPDKRHAAEMWHNLPNFVRLHTETVGENLIAIKSPSTLPIMRHHLPRAVLQLTTPLVVKINASIMIHHVRRVMKAFGVEEPILWLYSPYQFGLVGKFNEKIACYYNYDEFPEFVHNRRVKEILRKYDNLLSSRVDVVFATSRSQWRRRQAVNPNTCFSPNGVDFDLFNRALTAGQPLPADIAAVRRPVIGFAGWLGYQIDTALLLRLSEAFAECSIVLVGPDELPDAAARTQLQVRSNVFFLGRKELQQLPDYLQAFDVALIPYVLQGHVLSIYPMKLHEYLAAGRAVVSINLPELEPYGHVVRTASTHDEFVDQVRQALSDNSPEAIEARVAVARENTWEQRVEEIHRVLRQHLPGGPKYKQAQVRSGKTAN